MVRLSPEVEPEVMRKGAKPAGDRKSMNMEVAGNGSDAEDRSTPWTRAYLGMWVYVKLYVLADKLGMVGLQDIRLTCFGMEPSISSSRRLSFGSIRTLLRPLHCESVLPA